MLTNKFVLGVILPLPVGPAWLYTSRWPPGYMTSWSQSDHGRTDVGWLSRMLNQDCYVQKY